MSEEGTYIDVCCFCLDDGDLSGLVTGDEAGGCGRGEGDQGARGGHTLQNGPWTEGADRDGGEERGEEEEVLRTDDDLVEV